MWHMISYVSTASELSDFQIKELMHTTKLKNEALGITGILMQSDQNFFQIIEGEKNIINELYEKIEKDIRHFNLIKIFDNQIKKPSFKQFQNFHTLMYKENNYLELQQFLAAEKSYNSKNFKSISYLAHKFLKLS